jgi:tetratricopeptide (TPR) repeat protein
MQQPHQEKAGLSLPGFARSRAILLAGGALALLAVVPYLGTFSCPFLMDDVLTVARNDSIRHLWPLWTVLSPAPYLSVGGRPILNLTFALNYAWGGAGVAGYHAANLAIHVLAALTLFGLARRTLGRGGMRRAPDGAGLGAASSATGPACAIALLWALHPLQTESVTYVTQRAESLMGLFYLLTLYCFARGTEGVRGSSFAGASADEKAGGDTGPGRRERRGGGWFWAAWVCCIFGMLTKEVMATAPVIVFLYDRTFVSGTFRDAWRRHKRMHLALAATWGILAWSMADVHVRGAGFHVGVPWWAYALTECGVVVRYLGLAFWPHPLLLYREVNPAGSPAEAWPYAIVVLALLAATGVALARRPVLGFALAWIFVILAPTSSVVPLLLQPMAEHRMYLSLAAIAALVVGSLRAWLPGRGLAAAVAGLAVALGIMTAERNRDYRSDLSIWSQAVKWEPDSSFVQNNVGAALLHAGRAPEAMPHCAAAVRLNPANAEAHGSLGLCLTAAGRYPEAVAEFEEALRRIPHDPARIRYSMAIALERIPGRQEDAISEYQEALRLSPDNPAIHFNLAIALIRARGPDNDSKAQMEEVLRLQPGNALAQKVLAEILKSLGDTQRQ